MDKKNAISIFGTLGTELVKLSQSFDKTPYMPLIQKAIAQNPWFTKESVQMALGAIGSSLQKNKLIKWLDNYNLNTASPNKTVGIIMAGNIPLVGFHDLLCTLISGNKVLAKLSSKDQMLYSIIKSILVEIDSVFDSKIEFTDNTLKNIDAIIATGSDNSARYFEYYFSKYPNIIRKNRNSLAILTGDEDFGDMENIADDIFTYFGLGCRNVSFLLIPENYDLKKLIKAFDKYKQIDGHSKYTNNYDYQKAIMLMNQIPHYDNGFVLLTENDSLTSPIGVINYKYYKNESDIENYIAANKNRIQCAVSKTKQGFKTYGLGEAQQPDLWDYADNIDTLKFLLNL